MSDPISPAIIAAHAQPVSILMVEDEALFAKAVRKRLSKAGYQCDIAGTLAQARTILRATTPRLILLDMRLPDGSGLDLLAELGVRDERIPVLVLSAYGEVEDVVAAMKLHASDYLKKPVDLDELLINAEKLLAFADQTRRLEYSRKREGRSVEGVDLLGEDPKIVEIRDQAQHIGALCKSADLIPPTVLIIGETGTGKDLAARLLHRCSARKDRPFVHVDCAALPKDLIEAELFGHEKGAFTSAQAARAGLIEAAEDGVLFLDEIGELPLDLQAKLLAVLERRVLRRVGSTQERGVAAWIVAATNRDLEAMVRSGTLRSDLYFRINVVSMRLPPLRERRGDIALLAKHFLGSSARRYGFDPPRLSADALSALISYAWPGNVRELKHLMERAVLLSRGGPISAQALMLDTHSAPDSMMEAANLADMTLEGAERYLIERALERTGNNVSEAARLLGVTRMVMRYRMKRYGL